MKIKILYRWKNISVLEMFTHKSRLLCKYQFALGILITVYIRFLAYPVSFSDHILSVVLRCCCCCCCHRHKHFTFSSSSPEPLRQFQLNLVQNILGWWGLKFVQMKGPTFFQGNSKNTLTTFKNHLLQNLGANFNQTWHNASLG